MIFLTVLLYLFPPPETENWYSLLQSKYTTACSADYLIASGNSTGVLLDDLPLPVSGRLTLLPWDSATVTDPLQSGLWGGGLWNISLAKAPFQDSVSVSRIGLIQNTLKHSRYVFQLERPLPWKSNGNFSLQRDDTVRVYSMDLRKGAFVSRTMSWEGNGYGWGSWTNWSSGNLYARAGFSRLTHGDRRPELLFGAKYGFSFLRLETGASAAVVDSALTNRYLAGINTVGGSLKGSFFLEYAENDWSVWGGLSHRLGDFLASASFSRPADSSFSQVLAVRHPVFNVIGSFSQNARVIAADCQTEMGFFRGKTAAGWDFQNDSLVITGWLLAGFDWYRGRVESGPRFSAEFTSSGETVEHIDVLLGFTLVSFSFATAVEDLTHDLQRSWSFGITWAFTDKAPLRENEAERENGN